jgi:creatinine amidohydrolase/Fe(II)-dependent formamide hydrolase-like protein
VAPPAVFAQIVLLVLHGGVVAALTDAAREADDVFHGWLFGGGEKKKA